MSQGLNSLTHDTAAATTRRRDRWAARTWLWSKSTLQAARYCGRVPRGASSVALRVQRDHHGQVETAGYAGLQHCGSVWVCPCCAAKIATQRRELVAETLRRWHDPAGRIGGRAVMVTLTVRHSRGESLKTVWDAVAKAWSRATSGSHWKQLAARWGYKGRLHYLRFVEVTHGGNGWHVHVHALVFLGPVSQAAGDAAAGELQASMWAAWDRAVQRAGLKGGSIAQSDAHLVQGGHSELGQYFAKAAFEMTGSIAQTKFAKGDNMAPFEILTMLMRQMGGEEVLTKKQRSALTETWREWEAGSKGRRQMGVSQGLFDLVELDRSWTPTDAELADAETDGDVLTIIGQDEWGQIVRRGLALALLEAVCGILPSSEARLIATAALGQAAGAALLHSLARSPDRSGDL